MRKIFTLLTALSNYTLSVACCHGQFYAAGHQYAAGSVHGLSRRHSGCVSYSFGMPLLAAYTETGTMLLLQSCQPSLLAAPRQRCGRRAVVSLSLARIWQHGGHTLYVI